MPLAFCFIILEKKGYQCHLAVFLNQMLLQQTWETECTQGQMVTSCYDALGSERQFSKINSTILLLLSISRSWCNKGLLFLSNMLTGPLHFFFCPQMQQPITSRLIADSSQLIFPFGHHISDYRLMLLSDQSGNHAQYTFS